MAENKMQIRRAEMDFQRIGRMGGRHLSQIKEESDSREHSGFLQMAGQQQQKEAAEEQIEAEDEKQEVRDHSYPASPTLCEEQNIIEDNKSLLDELTDIEAELRESLHLEEERQREAEFLRQQENQQLWQNLYFLTLSQRISKPWVTSYFQTFPMHIYCLPVETVKPTRKRGQKK